MKKWLYDSRVQTLGVLLLLVVLLVFGLAGCASETTQPQNWTPRDTTAFEVVLPKGDIATCVYSNGGLDCRFPETSSP